jgi:hypothetical protein
MVTAGEYYKEQLLTFGIPPDKIQVTGLVEGQYINQPKFNLKIKNTRMKELGLTANRKICFIACSIDPVITDGILFLISRVIPRFQEINFLIKGHPTVSISNLIDKYNIGNCDNAETTLQPISDILPLSDYFLSSSSSTSLEALEYGVTQANLDVGGLPNANPLHLLPGLIKDIETEEDLVKFLQNPEMFKIEKEQAKKFFGNIGIDPIKVFTDAVTSNFH